MLGRVGLRLDLVPSSVIFMLQPPPKGSILEDTLHNTGLGKGKVHRKTDGRERIEVDMVKFDLTRWRFGMKANSL